MRFKRIIALLLVFAMIIPTGLIHAADLVLKDDLNIMKYTSAGLRDLEDTIDVTDESYEAEIIVTFEYGEASYPPDYVQLSIVEENPVGKRIVGNTLFVDKGAPAGTITIKAVLPDNFYTTHTITVNSGGGTPQPAQPRIAHTLLDTSDLNHLIISATALDDGIHKLQIRTFYKNASGMVGGDIVNLTQEGNSSVFSADITDQVSSKMRDSNAYEMTYFFTILDEDGGFLQYPEVIDMNSLEGALTVKLADPPDFSTAAIVEHTPPVVTSFDNIPATFKITQLQEGEVPTINVYYRSELTSDGLSIVKGMGQLTHVDGDTYTVNLADPEFKQMEAYTIEYFISTNRGYQWYYYPQGMNPYALTGLYSTSIPRELYGSEEPEEPEEPESPEITRDDLYLKVIEASDLYLYSLEGDGEGQYSRQAKDALNDAIMQAVDVYHYSDNQAEIKNAHQMLSDAIEIFRAAAVTPFQAKISYAQRIFDYTTVGTDYGQYPAEARDTLGAAITSAKEWNNPTSTEAELEAAYQALDAAITKFLDSEIKRGDPSVLQEKIGEIWDFLRFASEGDGPGQYPSSAYTDLYSVIDAANVLIRNSGTEAQINEAYENLVNALQVFKDSKNPDTNKVALQAGIETARAFLDASEVGTKVGQYPADSKDILQGSIDAAWETLINLMSTQLEVDQALASMNNSLANFKASVIKAGDNTALQAAITEAKILLEGSTEGNAVGEYPLEAMDLLASAITDAETLANEEATQAAMDEAILTLNKAVAAFAAAVIKEGNSTELQLKIEAARNLLSFSAEGDRPGEYPSEAFDALDKAVEAAETLMDSPGTQQQIDEAHHDLVQAIEAFQNAKIQEGEYAPLLMALSEAMTLYDTSPEGYGAGQYWPEVKALFMTAIEEANIVAGGPSTQEEIEEALQTLADAVEDFQKSVVRAGDSTNLQLAITDLTTLLSNSKEGDDAGEYPAGSKAILQSAVTAASNVISEPATQQEIDQAYEELIDAAGIFIAKIIPAGNISKALEKIYEVGRLLEASKAGTGVGQYPAEAIAALEAVFDAAIIVVDKPSSQVKLDATYQALVDAVDVFKKAQIQAGDTEEADAVVTSAETLLRDSIVGEGVGQYPLAAKTTLEAAIAAAKEVLEQPATQAQIDEAKATLEAAITAFVAKVNGAGSSEEADAVVSSAETLLRDSVVGEGVGEYPLTAKTGLEAAIAAAKEVLEQPATQAQIDTAKAALEAAITTFKNAVNKEGGSEEADAAVTGAETLLKDSVVGEGVGEYPLTAKTGLEAAIAAAKEVFEQPATQAQIDTAKAALEAAVATFKNAVNKEGSSEEADVVVSSAETLLRDSVVGEGVGEYPQAAKTTLEAAIAAAKEVLEQPATQVQIDTAKATLEAAIKTFEAAVNKEGSSEEADAVVTSAETLLRDSIVGEGVGQYPLAAKTTLEAAIAAAKEVLEQPVTQAQIDTAKAALEAAITTFKNTMNKEGSSEEADAAMTGAETLLRDSIVGEGVGQYPLSAKTTLEAAIAAAKEVLEQPATQAQIDTAKTTLEAAIKAFEAAVNKEGNSEEADAVVTSAETLLRDSIVGEGVGQYPLAAKTTLEAAIAAAKEVLEQPATQAQIDTAKAALEAAITTFKNTMNKEGSSEEADAAVTGAETLLRDSIVGEGVGQYPLSAKTTLEAAIAAAKEVFEQPATQAQIDTAKAALEAAITAFVAKVNGAGSSEEADAVVIGAETLLKDSVVGEGLGEYPLAAKTTLEAAIAAAKEVFENPATQAQIDEAKATLEAAIKTFEATVNKEGSSEEADAAVTEAEALLVDVPVGDGVGQYPSEAVDVLKAAIKAAKEVFEHPATQVQIDEAKATLEAAIKTFEAAVNKEGNSEEVDAAVTEAEALLVDVPVGEGVGQYPSEAVDVLKAAIKAAKEVFEHPATQAQIDEAKATLEAAIIAFEAAVNKEGSSEEADAAVTEAEALLVDVPVGEGVGQYPSEAVDVLKAAIKAAKEVLENPATQAQIDEAKATLEAAITAFEAAVNKEGDSEEADAVVTEAEALLVDVPVGEGVGQYPSEAVDVLKAAIKAAKEVFEHPATQAQIDEAKATLEAAITAFEAAVNKEGSSEEADTAVTEAEALLVDVPVGEGVGQYPSEAVDVLKAAIKAAKEVLENPATQAQIDEAKATLEAAVTTFKNTVNKEGSSEEADAAVTEAEALLVDVPVGEGVGQYPSEAVDVLKAAIKAAKEVLENPATQAQIDEAKATLEAAVTTFKNAVNKEGSSEEADAAVTEAEALLVDVPVGEGVGQYPSEAVDVLKAAIQAAKEVFENPATQAQIDEAKATLDAAITAFEAAVNKEGSSEEADAVVTEAEALLVDVPVGEGVGQYPAEAVEVLKAAIAAAKEVFSNPATQAQIDEARATLEAAITTFEAAINKEGSSEEADAAVTGAQTLLKDSIVGEGVGQYPAEAVKALEAAMAAAKEVLEHPATQAQIDAAKATLEAAVAAFEAAVIKAGNAGEIQAQITEAATLLNESTEGNGVGQYPAGSKAILQAAITAAENAIRTAATQAEIDKANEQLTAAYNAFRAAVIKTAPVDSYTPPVNSYTPPVSTDTPPAATQPVTQPSTKITDGLNTVETGQGTVKTAASEVQEIMKAAKPVILESTLGVIDFGKNGLNVPELKLGLGASLELGILMTEKSKTDEVLAGAKLDQAGMQPLGGKVLDLIAQLNYSNGTSTRIKSFAEPVKVTINLKELGLTGDTTNLTAVRFVPQADGTYKTIKLGGVYIPATNSFEFYTDSFSLYSIVKADSVTKITFKIDSKEYSIGALAKQNDVPPVIQEQRTLVPIRAVAEALGAEVKWDHATKTATITLDGKVLTMTLGELIEGMDVPAQAIDGRIMVPLRYVSEALGAYVMWFPQDKRIEIIR